jgi:hypothetical protein
VQQPLFPARPGFPQKETKEKGFKPTSLPWLSFVETPEFVWQLRLCVQKLCEFIAASLALLLLYVR